MFSPKKWNRAVRYAVAPVTVALALGCRLALNLYLHDDSPFMYFFLAIIVSGWLGGLGPGLIATALSMLAVDYYYMSPVGSGLLSGPEQIIQAISYLTLSAVVCAIVERMRREQRRAERSEQRERQRSVELDTVLQAVPICVWFAHDPEARHITSNRTAEEYLRLPPSGEASLTAAEAVRPTHFKLRREGRDLASDELPVQLAARGATVRNFEYSIVFNDGAVCHMLGNATPLLDEQGKSRGSVAAFMDITERKRTELALRQSEELFRGTFENAAIGMTHVDLNGNWLRVNQRFCDLVGYSRAELLGRKYWELTHPDDVGIDVAPYTQLIRGTIDYYDLEKRYITKDGREIWVYVSRALQRDSEGQPLYSITNVVDITERKLAEETLRRQTAELDAERARWKGVVEGIADEVWICDAQGLMSLMNLHATTQMGLKEFQGKSVEDLLEELEILNPDGQRRPPEQTPLLRSLRGEIVRGEEIVIYRRTGKRRWRQFSSAPTRDATGAIMGAVAIARDITDLRQAEAQLRLQAKALEAAANGIIVTDPDGTILWANPAYASMTGYDVEELVGNNPRFMKSGKHDEAFYRAMWETIRRGEIWHGELINRRKDGTLYNEEMVIAPVTDERGGISHYIAIKQDITERKRIEKKLKDSERRLTDMIEFLPDATFALDNAGKIIAWNKAMEDLTGAPAVDVLGKGNHEHTYRLYGVRIPCLADAVLRGDKAEWAFSNLIQEKDIIKAETYIPHLKPGGVWLSIKVSPMYDAQGNIVGVIDACRDITERKQMEEELRQNAERLAEADRRKDEFMAMLAHELRNPLAPIRYAAQMLHMNGLAQDQIQKQRAVIDRQVSHMSRLLDDLLDVSRITRGKITLKREIVDLRTIAAQALDSLRPMIDGRGQQLAYAEPSSPLPVNGDPTRLEQIIRNILHNANKYTEAGGCIQVSLGVETADDHEWRAVVRVLDSGMGIAPKILPIVFEAFVQAEQTLARTQGGLGIGLAMVKNLVQLHGGSVEAHSAGPGRGSEFIVRLPLAAEVLGELKDVSAPEEQYQAALAEPRRVLVVDDNEDSAASLSELLSLWGHEIQTAHDGRHALAAARKWQPEIILLDIGLPGMDGYEVARYLREDPATNGIFLVALTGYGQEEDRRRAREAGFNWHLTKPVELEQLQNILHERHE